ncbi:right-handed parallel beta-helix repeat-containing protein [Neobacillus niacini]|uniref:right-handed parallel beta-helix repeat-containing protein n=1 Tax=Neobacillus niacini TaxID=86668 RepID=UPI0005EE58AE|nr:right-handed parallel beta-helix repeat-containing protein [Neobacillus niacini]
MKIKKSFPVFRNQEDNERRNFLSWLFFGLLAFITFFSFKREGGVIDPQKVNKGMMLNKDENTISNELEKINAKLTDISVNVKSFGARGDGKADDTVPIQNAIDYTASLGGGIVYFPNGHFRTSSTISIDADYVSLVGVGCNSSYLSPLLGHMTAILFFGNEKGSWRWGNVVKDLGIRNSHAEGIKMVNNLQWKLEGIDVRNCEGNGVYGKNSWIGRLHNSCLYRNKKSGFYADKDCHALSIIGTHIIDNKRYGIYAPKESTITGNTFELNKLADIYIPSTKESIFIAGNYFEGGRSEGAAIHVLGKFISIDTNGLGGQPLGIKLEGASHVKVSNNFVGMTLGELAHNNLQTIYVDEKCKNIELDNVGTLTVKPGANLIKQGAVKDHLYPFGEFESLKNGVPVGWTKKGTFTSQVVPSFSGECDKALKVTTKSKHDRMIRNLSGLKPNTIYTWGAMISTEDADAVEVRCYNTAIVKGDEHYWSANFKKGHYIATTAFITAIDGSADISIGSAYLGTFKLEWIAVVEGYYTERNFPRKSNRENTSVIQSENGSYYKISVNNDGTFKSILLI